MLTLFLSKFKLRDRIFLGYIFPILFDLVIVFLVWYGFTYFKDKTDYLFDLSNQQEQVTAMANTTTQMQNTVLTFIGNGSISLANEVERLSAQLMNAINSSQLENKQSLTEGLEGYMSVFKQVTTARQSLGDLVEYQLPKNSLKLQKSISANMDQSVVESLIYRTTTIEKLVLKYFIYKDYENVKKALQLLKDLRSDIQTHQTLAQTNLEEVVNDLNRFEYTVSSTMTKTRTFLSLVSTVMAGHASEMVYSMDTNHKKMTVKYLYEQQNLKNFLDQFLLGILIVLISILTVSITVSFFVASTISRPIKELTHYYAKITNKQIDEATPAKPEYKAQDEIADLYHVLDDLMSYQKQMILMQRNESIGHMTRQVSHEFKNLMTPIIGFSSILKRRMDGQDEQAAKTLGEISDIAHKAVDLIRDMQIYTGEYGDAAPTGSVSCEIHQELEKNIKLIEAAVPSSIELIIDNTSVSFEMRVHLSRTAVTQILMNIVQNAIHAVETRTSPVISIRAYDDAEGHFCLQICNNGPQIPDSVVEKMFDPFYTTKEAGKGTGMGLSVVRGFIEKSGGQINVTTTPEKTCFDIVLSPMN